MFNQACTQSILGTLACCSYCILFYLAWWGGGKEGGRGTRGIPGMPGIKEKNIYVSLKPEAASGSHPYSRKVLVCVSGGGAGEEQDAMFRDVTHTVG